MFRQALRFHFAIGFVAFALLGAQALAAQAGVASDGRQVLLVWKVGPPSGEAPLADIPLNLERKAEAMGLRLEVRAFTASEFAQEFPVAFAAHHEPDIIAAENAFSIAAPEGYKHGPGIASDPEVRKSLTQVNGSLGALAGPRGGRQYLIATSEHAEAARRLALRPPDCDSIFVAETPVPPDIEQTAVQMAEAYLRAPAGINAYDDPARLRTEGVLWDAVDVRATKTCSAWGNDRLAFVSLVSNFEQDDPRLQPPPISFAGGPLIGQMPILLVLRKQGAGWRLLAASSDRMPDSAFLQQIPAIFGGLQNPAKEEAGLAPAQLLSPEDGHAPVPDAGQRTGYFTWRPSPSGNVVAQVLEVAYLNDDWLFFVPAERDTAMDQLPSGSRRIPGTEWKWRVWSIFDSGAITLSDYRTFRK
ncbi:MAG: hypothetical protein WAL45_14840 [Terracidiphilus sp.]